MKRKQKNVLMIIGIVVALFLIIKYIGKSDYVVVPLTEYTEKTSPYPCPATVSSCEVIGTMYCDNKQTGVVPKVVFRTNTLSKNDYNKAYIECNFINCPTEYGSSGSCKGGIYPLCGPDAKYFIAIPGLLVNNKLIQTNDLQVYCSTSTTGGSRSNEISTPTLYGVRLFSHNDDLSVEIGDTLRRYDLCNEKYPEMKSTSPLAGYESREIIDGSSSMWGCSGTFKISDLSGNVLSTQTLNCSSSTGPCSKSYSDSNIQPNRVVSVSGGDRNIIKYKEISTPQCFVSICNSLGTGYIECNSGQLGNTILCSTSSGEICKDSSFGASCVPPFTNYGINFTESDGDAKSGFTEDEPIYMKVNLYSQESTISSGRVDIQLYKTGGIKVGSVYTISNFNFKSNTPVKIQLTNPKEVAKYYAVMTVTFNSKTIDIPKEKTDDYWFRISPSISSSVNIKTDDGTQLYINKDIVVEVNAFDSLGATEVDEVKLDVKYKNAQILNLPSQDGPAICSGGVCTYRYLFNFLTPGRLDVSAYVTKSGVNSKPSSFSAEVKSIAVVTDFTNIGLYRCIEPSQQTLTFESKDSLGNYIDTINTVGIIEPDTTVTKDISGLVSPLSEEGKYKFSYDFTKIGAHTIKLTSFSNDYNLGSSPRSGIIEVKIGCSPDECTQTKDCQVGSMCINGKCVQKNNPITLYLIIGGVVIFFIFLLFIIRHYKNRRNSPNMSFGGL